MEEKEVLCCVTSCENPLDESYWNTRWTKNETGWDIGYSSPAITTYMDQYQDKDAAILIPGCGNAYEAEYLLKQGFTNITLIDIAENAVAILQEKFKDDTRVRVMCEDFFYNQGEYDLVIEQTFFCAIAPSRRKDYAKKMHELLKTNGRIIGVLFDRQFDNPFPPFGGCPCEYKPIFEPYFIIQVMDECYNSIPQRAGTEVFINMIRKD